MKSHMPSFSLTCCARNSYSSSAVQLTISLLAIAIAIAITIPLANAADKTSKETKAQLVTTLDDLPELTRTMQENLYEAAAAGDLDELRDLFETNELAPVLTDEHVSDPIDHWKSVSEDGTARDVMAALAEILALPPAKLENGDFIWPYLAAMPLDKLTVSQQIDLFRLAGPKQALAMLKAGKYGHYEAEIGKDGTWHYFKRRGSSSAAPNKTDLEKKPPEK